MGVCASDAGAGLNHATETRARKLRSDCRVTDAQLFDCIVAHFGILAYVAIAVGISRAALYKRIDRAEELQAARDAARAVVVAVAHDQLALAVHAGKPWALMFFFSADSEDFEPAGPGEPREQTRSQGPRETKEPKELVAEPQVADAATLKLVHGVERGEPWAVKYCLSHLEPGGEYEKKPRVRREKSSEGQPGASRQPSAEDVDEPRMYDARVAESAITHYAALIAEIAGETRRKPAADHEAEAVVKAAVAPTISKIPEPVKFVDAASPKAKPAPTINGMRTVGSDNSRTKQVSCYDKENGAVSILPPSLRRKLALPHQQSTPARSRFTRSLLPVAAAPTFDIGIAPTLMALAPAITPTTALHEWEFRTLTGSHARQKHG